MEKIRKLAGKALLLLIFASCNTKLMNRDCYQQIAIGMPIEEVHALAGAPYQIKKEGTQQRYEYIERFEIGPNTMHHQRYTLVVQEGKVVDKYQSGQSSPVHLSSP